MDCAIGLSAPALAAAVLVFFGLHAAPFAWLFARWGHRFYWGFVPAAVSGSVLILGLDNSLSCPEFTQEKVQGFALFMSCWLNLIVFNFFAPRIPVELGGYPYAFVVGLLAMPVVNAGFSTLWLVTSVRREELYFVIDREVSLKERYVRIAIAGVIGLVLGSIVAWN